MQDRFIEELESARRQMVEDQLYRRGIRATRVLSAFSRVPRHLFVEPGQEWEAYADRPLAIAAGQTISQPYIVAAMLEALAIEPHHRVLEIGTGSGYATALLCELAGWVYTVERHQELATSAAAILTRLGYAKFEVSIGDGSEGWREHAPYDAILVSAAAPHVPEALLQQLPESGRMVIPVGNAGTQELLLVRKDGPDVRTHVLDGCRFVPLIGRAGFRQQP